MHASKAIAATMAQQTKARPVITPFTEQFDWSFETFGDATLAEMLTAAKQFASGMELDEDPRWFCLIGTCGVGKTHLAKRILAHWRERSGFRMVNGSAGDFNTLRASRMISWPQFIERQRDGAYGEIVSIRDLPFVVIDDLGAEHGSDFAKARAYEIAEARLGKWTVLTSNLLLNQIAEVDTRIASRMLRGSSVIVEARNIPDYNLRKKKN